MSADDTIVVEKIHGERNLYGVFHVMGESEVPRSKQRAVSLWSHPIAAILAAFRHERDSNYPTEYGVAVTENVMADCENFYSPRGWQVKL